MAATSKNKPTKPSPAGFLTWLEAAERYGVSVRTLKQLAREGEIQRFRQHGRWETLLSIAELDKVLAPRAAPA